jgi:hypothetical protein
MTILTRENPFYQNMYPMLPVSLDCPFLIVPSVFSYVYLQGLKDAEALNCLLFLQKIRFVSVIDVTPFKLNKCPICQIYILRKD